MSAKNYHLFHEFIQPFLTTLAVWLCVQIINVYGADWDISTNI